MRSPEQSFRVLRPPRRMVIEDHPNQESCLALLAGNPYIAGYAVRSNSYAFFLDAFVIGKSTQPTDQLVQTAARALPRAGERLVITQQVIITDESVRDALSGIMNTPMGRKTQLRMAVEFEDTRMRRRTSQS